MRCTSKTDFQPPLRTVSENYKYKSKIVKKTTTTTNGVKPEYSEKILTYWSKKYYDKEVAERNDFYEFVKKYLEDPTSFRMNATQIPTIKKYFKKDVINKKTGELLKTSDLSAILDIDKLKRDYNLMGYYTLATSESFKIGEVKQLKSNIEMSI